MNAIEQKLSDFDRKLPFEQMRTIYKELLELKSQGKELPKEITDKQYLVTEAGKWVKKSASWVRSKIYDGIIPGRKNKAGKWYLTWEDVQTLIELVEKKHV